MIYRGQKEALAEFLPLDAENWIVCDNALRLDWPSVGPPMRTGVRLHAGDLFATPLDQPQIDFENEGGETYVCGNPPYPGSRWRDKKQQIVINPSEGTPDTALAIARCFHEEGLPPGVLNVVFGHPAAVSSHLMASPTTRKVSVTGSVAVGELIASMATDTLKRCTLELGGHAPVIVARDADVAAAARTMVAAKFRNAGQVCTSPTRFLIEEPAYEAFTEAFAEGAAALKVDPDLDPASQVGALVAERRVEWTQGLLDDALARGGRLMAGGQRVGNEGSFFAPTAVAGASPEMRAMNEEPFGPLALMMRVPDLDAALAEANRLSVGLPSYGFTRSQATALRLQSEINAGLVGINQPVVSLAEAPFGGVNETGWGSESGIEGLETFLRTKFVSELAM